MQQLNDILPMIEGEPVLPGDRVRLQDGSLMLVKTLALTADGAYVSADDVSDSGKPVFVEADGLGPAGFDTQEDLDADALLPVTTYVKKRALDIDPAATKDEKLIAMTRDIMARQRAVMAARPSA